MARVLNLDACNDDQKRRMAALVRMYKSQGMPEVEAQKRAWSAMLSELSGGVPVLAQRISAEDSGKDKKASAQIGKPRRKTGSTSQKTRRQAQTLKTVAKHHSEPRPTIE